MNTEKQSEIRELSADKISHVSGGILGEICLIVGACAVAVSVIGVADAKGVFDPIKLPF